MVEAVNTTQSKVVEVMNAKAGWLYDYKDKIKTFHHKPSFDGSRI